MKFTIVVRNKGKFLEIPMTRKEVWCLQDLVFMVGDIWEGHIKPNKMEKPIASVMKKFMFLGYDVKDDGRTYNTDGKMIEHNYLIKKPQWKVQSTYMYKLRRAGGAD